MWDGRSDEGDGREPRVIVWSGRSDSQAAELELVLVAAGVEHERLRGPDLDYRLAVPLSQARRAADELAAYRAERLAAPRTPPALEEYEGAWLGVAGYAAALLLAGFCAGSDVFALEWLRAGELEAGAVVHGQLWRVVTALTLHVDAEHLAGNLAFGAFFGYFAGRHFGYGLAWLSILAGGALGNLLNSFLQPASHRAIGASTAVFAALGMLTAHAWLRGRGQSSWRARLAPIAAGMALLAFTGTAGEHTDIVAHLMGFAAGFGLGALLGKVRLPRSKTAQAACAVAAAGVLVLAWVWGLTAAG